MPTLKDPFEYHGFNPDLHHLLSDDIDSRKTRRKWRKHISEVGGRWLGYAYDLIGLFTLATVAAILIKLLLN